MAHVTTEEERGEEARRILENPIYKEAFETIEARLIGQLVQIEITKERAEYLRTLLVANRKIRGYMQQIMTTGTMVAMEEEKKKGMASEFIEKARRFSMMG